MHGISYFFEKSFLLCPLISSYKNDLKKSNNEPYYIGRPVVPGGAGSAMAPLDFGRSVNRISTRRGRLCPSHYYWHPGFSDLPTALIVKVHLVSMEQKKDDHV